jgi:hyaluronoglucosaminidase
MGVEPPPAEGRPFPNLASVPVAPPAEPAATRKTEVGQLTAARDATVREDQQIRALNPGSALPPPRPRTGPAAQPAPSNTPPAPPADTATPAPGATVPPEPRSAATTMPRPQLPTSLFMGTVLVPSERGTLADFQRRVLQDSAAMAQRTNGRIRLVGGRTPEDRQRIVGELVALGVAASRITAGPDSAGANRVGIDVIVEN